MVETKRHLLWALFYGLIAAMLLWATPAPAETVLMDFGSTWCGPCATMSPTVDQLASEGYKIERIDIDRQPDIARQYGVSSIPCFVVVEQGREVDRIVGVTTRERLKVKMRPPTVRVEVQNQPRPAWRYEHPVGQYASVVRIKCSLGVNQGCLGSGVLVRWGSRIVVLTARHVVKDAKNIVVTLATGRKHNARVLVTNHWDCAVLQLDGRVEGVEPAEVATAAEARFAAGDRFTSCGYGGPETKLAANSGRFLGYKRSMEINDGRDDWFEISGPARQGDSGGPIFNEKGHVVGILWGTTGEVVVGVQAGRIGMVLNESVQFYKQQAAGIDLHLVPVVWPTQQRNPTPMPSPAPDQQGTCGPNGCPPGSPQAVDQTDSWLPWRKGVEGKIGGIEQGQSAINQKLDAILQQQQNQQAQPPSTPVPIPTPTVPNKPAEDGTKTIVGRIADKEAEWLEAHGGPISSRLAARANENLDDDSAAVRFKGFTQAKVALLIFCTAVVLVLCLGVWGLHRVNNKLIPKFESMAAKTTNTVDDKLVEILKGIHGRVDTVEERIKAQLPDFAGLKAKADAALHVATQAAVAVVPGGAPVAAGLVAANAAKSAVEAAQSSAVQLETK